MPRDFRYSAIGSNGRRNFPCSTVNAQTVKSTGARFCNSSSASSMVSESLPPDKATATRSPSRIILNFATASPTLRSSSFSKSTILFCQESGVTRPAGVVNLILCLPESRSARQQYGTQGAVARSDQHHPLLVHRIRARKHQRVVFRRMILAGELEHHAVVIQRELLRPRRESRVRLRTPDEQDIVIGELLLCHFKILVNGNRA